MDERTTKAQNGADLKIQFDTALTKEEARSIVNQSIETIDDNDIKEISSMTSIGTIFTETKDGGVPLLTWVVFDDHEDTLIWDIQAIPGSDISAMADTWSEVDNIAGQLAIDSLDDPIVGTDDHRS